MRDELDRGAGVTYLGPRSFVIGFAIICGAFLAIVFGANRFLQGLETPEPSGGTAATAPISATADPVVGSAASGVVRILSRQPSPTEPAEARSTIVPVVAPLKPVIRLRAPALTALKTVPPKVTPPRSIEKTATARESAAANGIVAKRQAGRVVANEPAPAKPTSAPALPSAVARAIPARPLAKPSQKPASIRSRPAARTKAPVASPTQGPGRAAPGSGMLVPFKDAPGLTAARGLETRPGAPGMLIPLTSKL